MKDSLYRLAARMPGPVDSWLSREECLLPYYHMVSDQYLPHATPLYRFRSEREFKADLDQFLSSHRAISASQFADAARANGAPPAGSFLLSFDDGFREMHDVVAPILLSKGVPAIFFLTSATVDNRNLCHHQKISLLLDEMSRKRFPTNEVLRILAEHGISGAQGLKAALMSIPWGLGDVVDELGRICSVDFEAYAREKSPHLTPNQIRNLLRQGFEIGAHSVDHPRYGDLSLADQLTQTRECFLFLESQFGHRRRFFAFPHTDRGVAREFFDIVTGEDGVEATFGTSGPARDCCRHSFQRFSMENTELPARAVLARHRLRGWKLRASGRTVLSRPLSNPLPQRIFAT